ncbi:MAG: hypothetical protein ACE5H4_06875 [Candidatus Thorarchaeota archaeon]
MSEDLILAFEVTVEGEGCAALQLNVNLSVDACPIFVFTPENRAAEIRTSSVRQKLPIENSTSEIWQSQNVYAGPS